ncbi:hypothetical protein O7632_23565 [Solwaraspora sp. WMMD406]|nr:hypothetical protein [Solwaraspora sp. WMMD406]MDG4767052.1 hypothetical protein [Solwaraspora sp. WMMD406]
MAEIEQSAMRDATTRDNAAWCAAVCRAHGIPGTVTDAAWCG